MYPPDFKSLEKTMLKDILFIDIVFTESQKLKNLPRNNIADFKIYTYLLERKEEILRLAERYKTQNSLPLEISQKLSILIADFFEIEDICIADKAHYLKNLVECGQSQKLWLLSTINYLEMKKRNNLTLTDMENFDLESHKLACNLLLF
jgi:hypothetical protein